MSAPAYPPIRTAAGAAELEQRTHDLSRDERLILIVVDGRRSLMGIRAQLRAIDDSRFQRALHRLIALDLIVADPVDLPIVELLKTSKVISEKALNESVHTLSNDRGTFSWPPAEASVERRVGVSGMPPKALRAGPAARGSLFFRRAVRFCLLAVAVVVLGGVAAAGVASMAISPRQLEQHLSAAIGRPVTVASTGLRMLPKPRLSIQGVGIEGVGALPELSIEMNFRQLYSGLASGAPLRLLMLRVPVATLSPPVALSLMSSLQSLSESVPGAIATVVVDSLRFDAAALLPRQYRLHVDRLAGGRFSRFELQEVGGSSGAMQLQVEQDQSGAGWSRFEMRARDWVAPAGPSVLWSDVVAQGRFSTAAVVIEAFEARAFGGAVQGAAVVARDVETVFALHANATRIDMRLLLESLAGSGRDHSERSPFVTGMARGEFFGTGRGDSLDRALHNSLVVGPVTIERAMLNGVNLGLAALHGGGAVGARGSGVTRFSELSALLVAQRGVVGVQNIDGQAGAMWVRGEINMAPDSRLSGQLKVILGGPRGQAPLSLGVRGMVNAPEFAN